MKHLPEYLTTKEYADLFRLNHQSVARMAKQGKIPYKRGEANRFLIPRSYVEKLLSKGGDTV